MGRLLVSTAFIRTEWPGWAVGNAADLRRGAGGWPAGGVETALSIGATGDATGARLCERMVQHRLYSRDFRGECGAGNAALFPVAAMDGDSKQITIR